MAEKPDALARPKRFYKVAAAAPVQDGFAVTLDGRTPRTPGGGKLVLPTLALAEQLVAEWDAQGEYIVAESMSAVRLANTAIDRIGQHRTEVAGEVARYAGSDLLCYFAEHPQALVEEEAARWGPLLDWAADALGVELQRVGGVIHRPQDPAALARVQALCLELDDFMLAGVAQGAGLFGSAILALALQRGRLTGQMAFELSQLDDAFQARQWGVDEEAKARADGLHAEALMLERWFRGLA